MTREKVCDLFIRRGFNLREVKSPDYTVVEHRGETVGCIYDDSVYVVQNYPSLNPSRWRTYANTQKTTIPFISAMGKLEEAIDFLLDSPSRMDREAREERVENVRKYFKDRKDADAVLSQPSFDYTEPTFIRKEDKLQLSSQYY